MAILRPRPPVFDWKVADLEPLGAVFGGAAADAQGGITALVRAGVVFARQERT